MMWNDLIFIRKNSNFILIKGGLGSDPCAHNVGMGRKRACLQTPPPFPIAAQPPPNTASLRPDPSAVRPLLHILNYGLALGPILLS